MQYYTLLYSHYNQYIKYILLAPNDMGNNENILMCNIAYYPVNKHMKYCKSIIYIYAQINFLNMCVMYVPFKILKY